ncbi:Xaa-Pro dipeptidyl-peptidase [Longispora albida]|uniref:Xaa-Pro dipeptidyl-peptidase n=1 Tax=Longispora albida TaxID=203523 RepID=UPI00037F959E|nr:Xaa-Pro dipeptidyl-peptidase [Longispora albida]
MRRVSLTGLVLVMFAVLAPPAQAAPRALQTDPIYSYADAIRETVWVESPVDNDGNGQPDRITADIIRPREATQRVPVIMDASPYYHCCGRGNESEKKSYAPDGTVTKFPLFYDNYFVPRGYAFIAADLSGTARSTGCEDVGGQAEVLGAKAVIDWLNGTAIARRADGTQAFATWSTGKVGMIGKSWDGTVANGVAATGVPGLATIVPISAISSWYDYNRVNGAVNPKVSSVPSLHTLVNSRPAGTCDAVRNGLTSGSDAATANYNAFWAARDYVPQASNVKASVFLVHGMNDLNVQGAQYGKWWQALAANNVPRKLWLSQEGHVDPFDFRRPVWVSTLHRWFDYWLMGIDNGIMNEPQATVERGANVWSDTSAWPPAGTVSTVYSLKPGAGAAGVLSTAPSAAATTSISDSPNLSESQAISSPANNKNGRKVYWTAPLAADLHLAGTPQITLRVKSSKSTTILSARLVDYGTATRVNYRSSGEGITTLANETCWGSSTAADDACYKETSKVTTTAGQAVLSRGWIDGAHRDSLSSPAPMAAGTWYTVAWNLAPTDQVIPAGHRLGLVLTLSDSEFVSPKSTGATVDVDLGRSLIRLPVAPAAPYGAGLGIENAAEHTGPLTLG